MTLKQDGIRSEQVNRTLLDRSGGWCRVREVQAEQQPTPATFPSTRHPMNYARLGILSQYMYICTNTYYTQDGIIFVMASAVAAVTVKINFFNVHLEGVEKYT